MFTKKIKTFKQQRTDALSIFHQAKNTLMGINKQVEVRRLAIASQITSLEEEDTEIKGVALENDATLVDINSILGVDPVKEAMENK